MKPYCGEAWTGPIAGALCSVCKRPDAPSVNQLARYRNGEIVERLDQFICTDCWNQSVNDRKAARKAELAVLARCNVPGCKRRGSWRVGSVDPALLCGQHLKVAKREHQRKQAPLGGLALFMGNDVSGGDVMRLIGDK